MLVVGLGRPARSSPASIALGGTSSGVAAVVRSGLEGAGVALRSRAQAAADACEKGGFMGSGGEQVSAGEQRCQSRCAPRSGLPEPSTQHLGPGAAAPRQIPHAEPRPGGALRCVLLPPQQHLCDLPRRSGPRPGRSSTAWMCWPVTPGLWVMGPAGSKPTLALGPSSCATAGRPKQFVASAPLGGAGVAPLGDGR